MPIGEGAFVDVLVTHVVSPDEFYVQKVSTSPTFYPVEIPPIWTTSLVPVFEWLFVICYFVFVYFGQVAGGLLVVLETTAIIKMLRLITIHF